MKKRKGNQAKPARRVDPNSTEAAQEFSKAAKAFGALHTRSPEAARKVLIEMGIVTPSGRLSRNYGG